jgi:hypothetical protein
LIASILIVLVAATGGTSATYWFDRHSPPYARVATGVLIGLTLLTFGAFAPAWVLGGLDLTSILAGVLVSAAPLLLLSSERIRAAAAADVVALRDKLRAATSRRPTVSTLVTGVYVIAILVGLWLVAERTFFWSADGLYIGNVNNLGDLPYHVQITASFAYGENFPPQNPVFAGSGFSYHYIADLLAAIFVATGLDLVGGILIVSLLLGAGLLVVIHCWAYELTGNAVAARLAPLILVFSGGFGWVTLLDQARASEDGIVATFVEGAERYTIAYEGVLRFGNAVTTLLIPQRGLLLGMGLAVIVLMLLWRHLDEPDPEATRATSPRGWIRTVAAEPQMLVAGLMTGSLPMIHVHTFAVVLGTAFFLGLLFREWRNGRWRPWVVYVLATLLVALPLVLVTARGSQADLGAFVGIELGWDNGTFDPFWFWFVNAGVFILLAVAGFMLMARDRIGSRKLLVYSLPFVLWFLLPNVLRLAPWLWDNIKVLIYWWLGLAPLVALVLARLWQQREVSRKLAAVALAFVLLASGFLDVARASIGPDYREFDSDGIAFAGLVRERTSPDSIVLTAPVFNTPIYLTGRRVFMGYAGYLWANGLPYLEREADVRRIYAGEPDAAELLRAHGIDYIVLGPHERTEVAANGDYFAAYPVVAEVGEYALLQVPEP